tara:strand:+ start:815 stop:1312 length:498 start_codon:yes stop_codon:yes gene_type:complete
MDMETKSFNDIQNEQQEVITAFIEGAKGDTVKTAWANKVHSERNVTEVLALCEKLYRMHDGESMIYTMRTLLNRVSKTAKSDYFIGISINNRKGQIFTEIKIRNGEVKEASLKRIVSSVQKLEQMMESLTEQEYILIAEALRSKKTRSLQVKTDSVQYLSTDNKG